MKETPGFLLHYETSGEFKKQYYGHLLRAEHLAQKNQINIPKFREPGMDIKDWLELDFWGYWFIKDGISSLISSTDMNDEEIDIDKLLPVECKDVQKLSNPKGDVFMFIRNPIPRSIEGKKAYTPKEFVDKLTCIAHSNPDQQMILAFMALSQLWDRSNYRVASIPSFGKDSIVDVCSSLFGGCGTIESPTIAKLEDRATVLKWLICNEVVDIKKEAWDTSQQFILTAGAHKNEITKHSRAYKNVGELIDISDLSLSLFYNDIDCYPDGKGGFIPYFDTTTKKAVRDRFPAFRFYGEFTEDFNAVSRINVKKYVQDHWDEYVGLIESFIYYKETFHDYMSGFNDDKLTKMKGRDATNMGRLLKIIDFYCETQEEFDYYMQVINDSMMDYFEMLRYPKIHSKLVKKLDRLLDACPAGKETKAEEKRQREFWKTISDTGTFIDKHILMEREIKGETVVKKTAVDWDNFEVI